MLLTQCVKHTSDGRDQDFEFETETETFILGLVESRPRPRLFFGVSWGETETET